MSEQKLLEGDAGAFRIDNLRITFYRTVTCNILQHLVSNEFSALVSINQNQFSTFQTAIVCQSCRCPHHPKFHFPAPKVDHNKKNSPSLGSCLKRGDIRIINRLKLLKLLKSPMATLHLPFFMGPDRWRMFYQDFLSALGPPHMAVAFHAGHRVVQL